MLLLRLGLLLGLGLLLLLRLGLLLLGLLLLLRLGGRLGLGLGLGLGCWGFEIEMEIRVPGGAEGVEPFFAAFFARRRACFSSWLRFLFASCCTRIAEGKNRTWGYVPSLVKAGEGGATAGVSLLGTGAAGVAGAAATSFCTCFPFFAAFFARRRACFSSWLKPLFASC